MSEFHDPELRQELGRLSGPYPDDNAAFVAWQRRVGQVRRRRAVAWTTTAAMSLIVVVVAAAAVQGAPGRHTLVPNQVAGESSLDVSTTHARSSSTESTAAPTTAATTTLAPNTSTVAEVSPDSSMPEENIAVDSSAAPTVTTVHKSSGPKATPASVTPAAPTAPTTAAPTTEAPDSHGTKSTVPSAGGNVTVRVDKGRLSVVEAKPSDGFEVHQSDHYDHRIVVTFTSSSHRSEVTIWLDNGVVKNSVVETAETHSESAPVTTTHGGEGG
ncbi:MAG: hypothetical protein QOC57_2404 [Ilumatobacteraceae bacterium]